jgi:hypothetical protein
VLALEGKAVDGRELSLLEKEAINMFEMDSCRVSGNGKLVSLPVNTFALSLVRGPDIVGYCGGGGTAIDLDRKVGRAGGRSGDKVFMPALVEGVLFRTDVLRGDFECDENEGLRLSSGLELDDVLGKPGSFSIFVGLPLRVGGRAVVVEGLPPKILVLKNIPPALPLCEVDGLDLCIL